MKTIRKVLIYLLMIDWTNQDAIGVLIGLGMIAFGLIGLLMMRCRRGKQR